MEHSLATAASPLDSSIHIMSTSQFRRSSRRRVLSTLWAVCGTELSRRRGSRQHGALICRRISDECAHILEVYPPQRVSGKSVYTHTHVYITQTHVLALYATARGGGWNVAG